MLSSIVALLRTIPACTRAQSRYVRLEATHLSCYIERPNFIQLGLAQYPICACRQYGTAVHTEHPEETRLRFELSLTSRPWLSGRHGLIQLMPIGICGKFRLPERLFAHDWGVFLRQVGLEFGLVSNALNPFIYSPLACRCTTGHMVATMVSTAPPCEET